MSNATTIYQLERESAYLPDGAQEWISEMKREIGRRNISDTLTVSKFTAQTDTETEVTDNPAYIWGVYCKSPAGASATTFVQIFNIADTGVTSGTTVPTMQFQVLATQHVFARYHPFLRFDTAISLMASTASGGTTANAAADRPDVWIVWSAI